MATLMGAGGMLIAFLVSLFFMKNAAKKAGLEQGRKEGQQELARQANTINQAVQARNEQVLQQVEQVHEVHDKLSADADYAQRVRDRFTRPD